MKEWHHLPLLDCERKAILAAVRAIKTQFPIQRVILFGSKARGNSDEHSDIDLVLISLRPLDWREEKAIVDILFDIGMEQDVIFSPFFVDLDDWQGGILREFPIYQEIVSEGAVIS